MLSLVAGRIGGLVAVTLVGFSLPLAGGHNYANATSGVTYPEQQGRYGVDTFADPHAASGPGPRVEPEQWVEVSCKVYAPEIESAKPDGYWYLLASAPWNNQYYAPANTFMNGDPWGGPFTHFTDFNVHDCGTAPAQAPPTPDGVMSVFFTGAGDAGYDAARRAGADFILTDNGSLRRARLERGRLLD